MRLPPGAGSDPAGPPPRGTGRPRHPRSRNTRMITRCTNSAAPSARPLAITIKPAPIGKRRARCCPKTRGRSTIGPGIAPPGPSISATPSGLVALRGEPSHWPRPAAHRSIRWAGFIAGQFSERSRSWSRAWPRGKAIRRLRPVLPGDGPSKAGPRPGPACFYRAVRWWGEHKNLPAVCSRQLTGFRAEAEAVLALAGPSAQLPGGTPRPEYAGSTVHQIHDVQADARADWRRFHQAAEESAQTVPRQIDKAFSIAKPMRKALSIYWAKPFIYPAGTR